MRYRRKSNQFTNKTQASAKEPPSPAKPESSSSDILNCNLKANLQQIKKMLGNSTDIIIREVPVSGSKEPSIAVIYTDGLADPKEINNSIMRPISSISEGYKDGSSCSSLLDGQRLLDDITSGLKDFSEIQDYTSLLHDLLSGDTILIFEGLNKGISVSTPGWKDRGVTETSAENVVRGPREAFSESIRTNTALVRRKIKDPDLRLETQQIGRRTQTNVSIMFIQGIANEKIVQEVRDRLAVIDVDGILESGYIEEIIQDKTLTPFPTIYNTERPDVVAAELLEGKVVILVDGTPFVLVVPALFVSFLHAAEDYYQRADISSFLRMLRYLSIFISLLAPSLYVAISTFHQEMLPTQLLFGLASQREQIPFPAFVEALLMELTFEILREAGVLRCTSRPM